MIKKVLRENLADSLKKIGAKLLEIHLEHPANEEFGDYSTNISLQLAKQLKKSSIDLANTILKNLPKNDLIEKAEVVKPGFINFWIVPSYFLQTIESFSEEKFSFPHYFLGPNKKLMIEFAHPNTHKLFHIGHLRNISIGESIVRVFETVGNKVIRTNYQGDVGLHIAKCLYQVRKWKMEDRKLKTLEEKIRFLGEAYAEGQNAYENDAGAKQEILDINGMIYEKDPKILDLWKETRQWSLDYYAEIYKRVYSHFDRFYFESELPERGVEIVKDALEKGILEKSEGAVVFNGKKYRLDTRVFINSLGFPTYEGKELALAEKEFSEFGEIDKCIHIVTPEQKSFFKVTFKVEELLDEKKYKNKQYHLAYEWVKLKEGKMSSRRGNVVEANWLIDQAKEKILEKFKCPDSLAEIIAVASVKYSFLKNSVFDQIAFDFAESISLEGNSGPYLLYTYVRTQSVLKKANDEAVKQLNNINDTNLNKEEKDLLRTLFRYTEIVEEAAQKFAPNYIANYLYDLAQKFNYFYQKHPILKADDKTKDLRLLLTKSVGTVIKNGLYLLGIKTVKKM